MRDFIECLDLALSLSQKVTETESLPLRQCLGRVLAKDVIAQINVPANLTSIKDGYAIRSADGQNTRRLAAPVRAGDTKAYHLLERSASYVTTGSVLPEGADAVVEIENVTLKDNMVTVRSTVIAGQDVRQVGSDIKAGSTMISVGTRITPTELGVIATLGYGSVTVFRKPRVAVVSSGDELVEPGTSHEGRGIIFDCNRIMILSAVDEFGAEGHDLGLAADTLDDIGAKFHQAALMDCDLIITSGAVSEGDRDCIRHFLELNGIVHFNKVNIKPGKPMTIATWSSLDRKPRLVVAVPGNPVSALVMFTVFGVPILRKLSGQSEIHFRSVFVRTSHEIILDDRPEFVRAAIMQGIDSGTLFATSTGLQRSSRVASTLDADVLLRLPGAKSVPGGKLTKGHMVEALIFRDWRHTPSLTQHMPRPIFMSLPSSPVNDSMSPQRQPDKDSKMVNPTGSVASLRSIDSLTVVFIVEDLSIYDYQNSLDTKSQLRELLKLEDVHVVATAWSQVRRLIRAQQAQSIIVLIYKTLPISINSNLGSENNRLKRPLKSSIIESLEKVQIRSIPGVSEFARLQQFDSAFLLEISAFFTKNGVIVVALADQQVPDWRLGLQSVWHLLTSAATGLVTF